MNVDEETVTVLTAVHAAVHDAMPGGGPDAGLAEVMAGARKRRHRRLAARGGVAGVAVAACAALAVSLTGPGTGGRSGVSMSLAAWSVRDSANGTITLTVRQLQNPRLLEQVLTEDGVPTLVNASGGACAADSAPGVEPWVGVPEQPAEHGWTMLIPRSAVPRGAELYISADRRFTFLPVQHPSGNPHITWKLFRAQGWVSVAKVPVAAYAGCR